MKRSELFFSAILVPLDYLTLILAAVIAYLIRFLPAIQAIRPVIFDLPFKDYFILVLIIALFWLLIFSLAGLYEIVGTRRFTEEFFKIFLACSTNMAAVMAVMFFTRYLFESRFIILAGWILSIIFIAFERLIIRIIQRQLYKIGIGVHRVIIIGDGQIAESIIKEFKNRPTLGYKIINHFKNFSQQIKNELTPLAMKDGFDEIIQVNPDISQEEKKELINFIDDHHLVFKYSADLLGKRLVSLEINTDIGIPIVEIKKTPLDGWGRIYKRIFDIVISLFLIILTAPIALITALAIRLDSAGPVFFKYKRVGEKGKSFTFIKFRSMIKDAHKLRFDPEFLATQKDLRAGTPIMKFKNDPRITRVGKFIRRWSIDELPQLFLVLIGKISLVGPRPHEIEEVAKYRRHHRKVLTIKPGITGLAQVSGRSDLDFEEEVKLDNYYIENWSPNLDLQIILKTPTAIIKKRKAE